MYVTSATDSMAAASAASTSDSSTVLNTNQNLDESDFLMLLITELANQDPLDPMSDRDFIAQMAELNTLNEIEELNENITAMQFLQTSGLIGHEVDAIGPDGQPVSGVVAEVRYADSEPWLVLDSGAVVGLDDVIRIK
ncbi:flagellar hook capping protein [Candidatus Poribacteria bacterium]|nr:flagellar hook capping protein [Candidatus Poribacteria bacterium]